MLNYENSKIYKLISNETDLVYIGSTCNKLLCKRLGGHRNDYKNYLNGNYHYMTSFEIVKYGDCKIELNEEYCCENMEQLRKREGYYIRNIENCVNKCIAGRTVKQYRIEYQDYYKEYKKNWYEENLDYCKEKNRKYKEENLDKIKENNKKYYDENLDKIKENKKKYYEKNSDCFKEKNRITINCEICNCIITKCNLTRHEKSKKHLNNLINQDGK